MIIYIWVNQNEKENYDGFQLIENIHLIVCLRYSSFLIKNTLNNIDVAFILINSKAL